MCLISIFSYTLKKIFYVLTFYFFELLNSMHFHKTRLLLRQTFSNSSTQLIKFFNYFFSFIMIIFLIFFFPSLLSFQKFSSLLSTYFLKIFSFSFFWQFSFIELVIFFCFCIFIFYFFDSNPLLYYWKKNFYSTEKNCEQNSSSKQSEN